MDTNTNIDFNKIMDDIQDSINNWIFDDENVSNCFLESMKSYVLSATQFVAYSVKKQYVGKGKMYLSANFIPDIYVEYSNLSRVVIFLGCDSANSISVRIADTDNVVSVEDAVKIILDNLKSHENTDG